MTFILAVVLIVIGFIIGLITKDNSHRRESESWRRLYLNEYGRGVDERSRFFTKIDSLLRESVDNANLQVRETNKRKQVEAHLARLLKEKEGAW